ncbi:hypothetical protein ABK040_008390 [Willaertia magna]
MILLNNNINNDNINTSNSLNYEVVGEDTSLSSSSISLLKNLLNSNHFLVLIYFQGDWSTYCKYYLNDVNNNCKFIETINQLGGKIVAFTSQVQLTEPCNYKFDVFIDHRNELANELDIFITPSLKTRYPFLYPYGMAQPAIYLLQKKKDYEPNNNDNYNDDLWSFSSLLEEGNSNASEDLFLFNKKATFYNVLYSWILIPHKKNIMEKYRPPINQLVDKIQQILFEPLTTSPILSESDNIFMVDCFLNINK